MNRFVRLKKVKVLATLILLSLSLTLASLPQTHSQVEEAKSGSISYAPNVIPSTEVYERVGRNEDKTLNYTYGSGERFRFAWLNNTFDIELFFNATYEGETKLFSLLDFEDDFDVSVQYVAEKNESHCRFGWLIENIGEASEAVHNAWFKIEDTKPFDYDEIEVTRRNRTVNFLPDGLRLSFADLEDKGFIVGSQNKTATEVRGFSGKSSWDLDPITYSSPIITVDGTYTDVYEDIYLADQVGGWGVFTKTGNRAYACNGTQIDIGDAVNETVASASFCSVNFFDGGFGTALRVRNNATLTLGS